MAYTFNEEIVKIKTSVTIEGTLAIPDREDGKLPAVLILPGSGQIDRDANAKKQKLFLNIYKDMSDELAGHGYVTLRCDKRGVGESEGDYFQTGLWDLVEDSVEALRYLKNHPRVDADKVFIMGHSEGSILAPAVQQKEKAAGLILLSGVAESLSASADRQFSDAIKSLTEMKGVKGFLIRFLRIGQRAVRDNAKLWNKIMTSNKDFFSVKGRKLNAKWLREHKNYNVLNDIKKTKCPILAVTGSKDVQVVPEHAKLIAEASAGKSEWHILEGVNHILRVEEDNVSINKVMDEYKKELSSGQTIDRRVFELIENWLDKTLNIR